MTLTPEQFEVYNQNPLDSEWVRRLFNLPENKYFTVSVWPIAGEVRASNLSRTVKAHKVSKSDQK